jgi:hypothetical protein
MSDSASSSPKTPRAKAVPKPKFVGLSYTPHITDRDNLHVYHCDLTAVQTAKRAGIPFKTKDGKWKLMGAFANFHCVKGYLDRQLASKAISREQYDVCVKNLNEYLGVENVESPSVDIKELTTYGGKTSFVEFDKTAYKKLRVDHSKYLTPEQDRAAQEAKKLAAANKPEDDSRKPLQVYAKEERVGGIKNIADLLTLHEDDKADKVHGWLVASVPAEASRFAVKRVVLDKEKDKDLLETVATGLAKPPGQASLPAKQSAGRGPILVVPRSVKIGSADSAGSPAPAKKSRKSQSPAASRKRKGSDSDSESESSSSRKSRSKSPSKPKKPARSPAPKKKESREEGSESSKSDKKAAKKKKQDSSDESSSASQSSRSSSPAGKASKKKAGSKSPARPKSSSPKPEKKQTKKAKAADASEESSSASQSPSSSPARKPRKELTAEQKQAAKDRRAAKKKAASAAAPMVTA